MCSVLLRSYWGGVESGIMGSVVKSFSEIGNLRGSDEQERNVSRKMVQELCGDLVSMRYMYMIECSPT